MCRLPLLLLVLSSDLAGRLGRPTLQIGLARSRRLLGTPLPSHSHLRWLLTLSNLFVLLSDRWRSMAASLAARHNRLLKHHWPPFVSFEPLQQLAVLLLSRPAKMHISIRSSRNLTHVSPSLSPSQPSSMHSSKGLSLPHLLWVARVSSAPSERRFVLTYWFELHEMIVCYGLFEEHL